MTDAAHRGEGAAGGFFRRLQEVARRNDSLLCVGLDPDPERIAAADVFAANRRVIDATAGLACAYKPNIAFYEAHGVAGMEALVKTIRYVRATGCPAILDAKRNDIASTAAAYARAAFDAWGADALTVNPLLGGDTVEQFTGRADRGVFVLCHTSNPGATELQDIDIGGERLYQRIARLAGGWNARGNVGLVVGATYPDVIARVRAMLPDMWILVPGVGAQGGDLEGAVSAGLTAAGGGVLVNVSRAVYQAADPGSVARGYRDRINAVRARADRSGGQAPVAPAMAAPAPGHDLADDIALGLHDIGAVRFGEFTLKSGQKSPIYVDLRLLVSDPRLMEKVAHGFALMLEGVAFDRIAAIPYGGLPIGQAVALRMGKPLIYPRKEVKDHGTRKSIEGLFSAGETVLVLDDVVSTGGSKLEAIGPLAEAGLAVKDIAVLVDRDQGGRQQLQALGYRLHAVLTLRELLAALVRRGRISRAVSDEVLASLGTA